MSDNPEELLPVRGRSRGRPATPPEPSSADPEGTEHLSRRSRRFGSFSDFDLSAELRARHPGWDFQWITVSVMGQPTDASSLVGYRENHWTPVDADWFAELVPPGWEGKTIERGGMRLYKRPMRLTLEARREDLAIANEQKDNKLASAMATPTGTMPRTVTQLDTAILPPGR